MEKHNDTVQALADELGFDFEMMLDLLIELGSKTVRWNLKADVHPLDALNLDDMPQVDHAPPSGPWGRLLNPR